MSVEREEGYLNRGGDVVRCSKMKEAIDAVCQLTQTRTTETSAAGGKGSGFLGKCTINGKEEKVILTMHHVVDSEEMAKAFDATFNFDGIAEAKVISLDPDVFFRTSKVYDYTMIGVKEDDINYLRENLNIHPINLTRVVPADLKKISMIQIAQHPKGKEKRFSVGCVRVIQGPSILYEADTDAGSSGSPVFFAHKEMYRVIAFHKSGGGTVSSSEHKSNRGILINVILDHVNGAPIQLPQTTEWYQLIPQEIARIAKRIPDKWQMVGLSTGYFKKYELTNIQCCIFYHDGVSKGMEMLCNYQKRKGTREALAGALKECGEDTLAEKVLQRYYQFYAE